MTAPPPLAAPLARGIPVLRSRAPSGVPLPGLRGVRRLELVGGEPKLRAAIAGRLTALGIPATEVREVSDSADGVIFLAAAPTTPEEAIAINCAGFRAARQLARNTDGSGGPFVTVQDLGGGLGLDGTSSLLAWSAGLAGLTKTVAQEWPAMGARAIDLSGGASTPERCAEQLVDELLRGGVDREVALDAEGARRVVVHEPAPLGEPAASALSVDTVVVATGGGRGVTAVLMRELARLRVRLVLVGSTPLRDEPAATRGAADDEVKRALLAAEPNLRPRELSSRAREILVTREIQATLTSCREAGSEARYVTAELRDAGQVERALHEVRAVWGPIGALIHGAGVLADRLIGQTSDEDFDRVFDTKVLGLRHLLAATEADPLRALVLFSSIAGRLGNPGQVAYAMANEVLARVAAAEARRRPHCMVRALAWGPWNGGMVSPAFARILDKAGVALIEPAHHARSLVEELASQARAPEVILVAGALPPADGSMRAPAAAPPSPPPSRRAQLMVAAPEMTPALRRRRAMRWTPPLGRPALGRLAPRSPVAAETFGAHSSMLAMQRTLHEAFLAQQAHVLSALRGGEAVAPLGSPSPMARRKGRVALTADERAWYLDDGALAFGALLDPVPALMRALGEATRPVVAELRVRHRGARPRVGVEVVSAVEVEDVGAGVISFRHEVSAGGARWLEAEGRAYRSGAHVPLEAGPLSVTGSVLDVSEAMPRTRDKLTSEQVRKVSAGDLSIFGARLQRTSTHTRTPRLPPPPLLQLHRVTAMQWGAHVVPQLRAAVSLGDEAAHLTGGGDGAAWCLEAARQAACLLLIAMGATVDKDGWRFEPIDGGAIELRAGRHLDASRELELEIRATELALGHSPRITVDVEARRGGFPVMRARGVGVGLVRDWPMSRRPPVAPRPVAPGSSLAELHGVRFDFPALLAGAWGRPRDAFGELGALFEAPGRSMPRLPGPPYHFITRVARVEGAPHSMRAGVAVSTEYDVPPEAWYFAESGADTMPWCVLLEVALQPCGWLSVYAGCPLVTDENIFFRNLDGAAEIVGHVGRDAGTVRVEARLTRLSHVSGIMLVSYEVTCSAGDEVIARLWPGFGYFPRDALAVQVGLPPNEEESARFAQPSAVEIDLSRLPARYTEGALRLPCGMLRMLDRITGYWPDGGAAGLGRVRGERLIDPDAWYFKAHFFDDPVQPGSLGLEMTLQLLQFLAIHEGLAAGISEPRFEPIACAQRIAWKLRGQVLHTTRRISAELEVLERWRDAGGLTLIAAGWLWSDDTRVYEIKRIGLRISSAPTPPPAAPRRIRDEVLDPSVATWVGDHRPNFTIPVVPLMSIVDRLAAAAIAYCREAHPEDGAPWRVVSVDDTQVKTWLTCARAITVRTEVWPHLTHAEDRVEALVVRVELSADRDTPGTFQPIAAGWVELRRAYPSAPPPWPRLADAVSGPDVYASGALFHGPAFQLVTGAAYGARGSTTWIDPAAGTVPMGCLHQALLDAALHGIPHDELDRWSSEIPPRQTAFPSRVDLQLYAPPPTRGRLRCEARLVGFRGAAILPTFDLQVIDEEAGQVWLSMRLVEVLVPVGAHGHRRRDRISFLRDRVFTPRVGLSAFHAGHTELAYDEVRTMDWLKGSVAYAYGLADADPAVLARQVAIKDHVAQRIGVHPALLELSSDGFGARDPAAPETHYSVRVVLDDDGVKVFDAKEAM
jgi:3-hydroxymyristoyl/3-hydroxydecanoyl-(acyl carrier protein) dehydratase